MTEFTPAIARMFRAMSAITEANLPKGIGHRIKCPNCQEGELHFYVNPKNKHRRAYCTTPDCTQFIE